MQHIIGIEDFTLAALSGFFSRLREKKYIQFNRVCNNKILASVFFSASLRTRTGFESAMLRLGGSVVAVDCLTPRAGPNSAESIDDIVQTVSVMSDVIVLRSRDPRSVVELARLSSCPLINGGNGVGPFAEHPTQAIADLFFIEEQFGDLIRPEVLLVGSPNHRVIRSLLNGFSLAGRQRIHVAYPEGETPIENDLARWTSRGMTLTRVEDIRPNCRHFDVIYHNGVPRASDGSVSAEFTLSPHDVDTMKPSAVLMHSMPRDQEYSQLLDNKVQAVYFAQSEIAYHAKIQLLCDLVTGIVGSEVA